MSRNNGCGRGGGPRRRRPGIGGAIAFCGVILVIAALDWSLIALLGCLLCIAGTALAMLL